MSVIAAGEFDDLGAFGESAGQADRTHGGLGAGVHQPDPLHRGDPGDDLRGQLGFTGRRCAEGQPIGSSPRNGLHHGRMGVAEDHRAPGADQVDVAVAIGIGEPTASRRGDEAGCAADGVERPHRGVHSARDDRAGLGEEFRRDARGSRRLGHGHQCSSWDAATNYRV